MSRPKIYAPPFTCRLTKDTREALGQYADRERRSLAQMARIFIEDAIMARNALRRAANGSQAKAGSNPDSQAPQPTARLVGPNTEVVS